MIAAGHMQKCLWARAQNLPAWWVRNTARLSLIPETAGVACSREGEKMEIFIKNPPFFVTFATCANESKSHMEYSPMAVALYPIDSRGEPGRLLAGLGERSARARMEPLFPHEPSPDSSTCPHSGTCWNGLGGWFSLYLSCKSSSTLRCCRSQAVPCTVPSVPGSTGMGTAGGTGVTAQ